MILCPQKVRPYLQGCQYLDISKGNEQYISRKVETEDNYKKKKNKIFTERHEFFDPRSLDLDI